MNKCLSYTNNFKKFKLIINLLIYFWKAALKRNRFYFKTYSFAFLIWLSGHTHEFNDLGKARKPVLLIWYDLICPVVDGYDHWYKRNRHQHLLYTLKADFQLFKYFGFLKNPLLNKYINIQLPNRACKSKRKGTDSEKLSLADDWLLRIRFQESKRTEYFWSYI